MEKEKTLHIEYPAGYMDIRIEKFFPATLERAEKVFRLMRDYSRREDMKMVHDYLFEKLEGYIDICCDLSVTLSITTDRKTEREASEKLRYAKKMRKRSKRNIELLQKITKYKEE